MDENKLIEIMREFVSQVNIVNKRMVYAMVAIVACLCITGAVAVYSYFYSDYPYSIVTQTQTGDSGQTQTVNNGGIVAND